MQSRRGHGGHQGRLWLDFDDVHWRWSERGRGEPDATSVPSVEPPPFVLSPLPALAPAGADGFSAGSVASELALSRPGWSRERRRRLLTRFVPTIALAALSGAALLWLLAGSPRPRVGQPLHAPGMTPAASSKPTRLAPLSAAFGRAAPVSAALPAPSMPAIEWRSSRVLGVPHAGRLVRGVHLPASGPGWVTWDPVRDRSPNRPARLWGTDGLVRTLLAVIADYRAAHPSAPALVIGDISLRHGGPIDEHVSHQNGLDVDIYYPRLDGKVRPPSRVSQIDRALAQDLVDRFVAAGAQVLFVGRSVGLRGPTGVVVPYANHDDHVHVRFPPVRA